MRALALLLHASVAMAGPTMTKVQRVGRVELRDPKGVMQGQYDTLDACAAAIPLPTELGEKDWTCKPVYYYRVTPSCEPAPAAQVDPDGFTIIDAEPGEPVMCPNGVEFEIAGMSWVDHPYPVCGGQERVVYRGCGLPDPDETQQRPLADWDYGSEKPSPAGLVASDPAIRSCSSADPACPPREPPTWGTAP